MNALDGLLHGLQAAITPTNLLWLIVGCLLGTLVGGSDLRMLEEAERGEDTALARYRKALKRDDLPPLLRGIIERQMDGVQRNHDQVKALRDVARAEA